MATLQEIRSLFGDGDMIQLVETAIVKKCAAILDESPITTERRQFAEDSLKDPGRYSASLWRYLLGANSSATLENLTRAQGSATLPTDATIETEVNTAIDALWP